MTNYRTNPVYRDVTDRVRHNHFVDDSIAGVLSYSILFDIPTSRSTTHVLQVVPNAVTTHVPYTILRREEGLIRQTAARALYRQVTP